MEHPIFEAAFDESAHNAKIKAGTSFNDILVIVQKDKMIFPEIPTPIPVPYQETAEAFNLAIQNKERIFVTTLKEGKNMDKVGLNSVYRVGVIMSPLRIVTLPNGEQIALCFGNCRGKLTKLGKSNNILRGVVQANPEVELDEAESLNKMRLEELHKLYDKLIEHLSDSDKAELKFNLESFNDYPTRLMNFMISNSPIDFEERYKLLMVPTIEDRLRRLIGVFDREIEKIELRKLIHDRTHEALTEQQRDAYLNQQIRVLQEELGVDDLSDIKQLRDRFAQKTLWSDELKTHFEKEVRKLERFNPSSPDYATQYTYLDTLLNLPWNYETESEISIPAVRKQLDADHYGLDKVKERILEHVAVLKLREDMKAPIICLYGPPGVGKTSLGKSVAMAMNRNYNRLSLGGLHDEAEIRGHRRTYIGAMPGRIIFAMLKAGSANPVIVLDEIDKIGNDYKGDPSQALLEVLDPEQNSKFHDNYVDFDYDLSKVFFIATANDLSTISRPLLDRMEIIEIPGYATEEKLEIASRHIIPKVLNDLGMNDVNIEFTTDAIETIITNYTREAGVRQLEKKISAVLRKIAVKRAENLPTPSKLDVSDVKELLGRETVYPENYENNDFAGVVTGLAWTAAGGDILFVETSLSKGKGEKLTLTGNLGDVMKESAAIALQWLRCNGEQFGISADYINQFDVHIHVPEGAVPKDGPSAGVTMVTSLASAFTRRKVRSHLAMTGEISLRGKVLPVGGIKEKILAAKRAGIKTVLLCSQNRKDIEDINPEYIKGLEFKYVDRIEEVLEFALLDEKA